MKVQWLQTNLDLKDSSRTYEKETEEIFFLGGGSGGGNPAQKGYISCNCQPRRESLFPP